MLTIRQACEEFNLREGGLRQAIRAGRLPVRRAGEFGERVVVDRQAILDYIEARRQWYGRGAHAGLPVDYESR